MRKDGNVASKAEILDHVWGIDFAGDPNVVEVYVGYLRKKIDAAVRRRSRSRPSAARATGSSPMSDDIAESTASGGWWPQTVRVRLTIVATLAFAITISAAAFGLVRSGAQQPGRPDRGDQPAAARLPRRRRSTGGPSLRPDSHPRSASTRPGRMPVCRQHVHPDQGDYERSASGRSTRPSADITLVAQQSTRRR